MDTLTEVQLQKDINLINDIEPESFKLQNYKSYPAINVKMLERDK
jgi:thymidylate synthase